MARIEDEQMPPLNLQTPLRRRETRPPPEVPHISGDGSYGFDIVGEANYQNNLEIIAGGKTDEARELECLAFLVPEPSNPYDRNAVRVEIRGMTVGYVPRAQAASIGSAISRSVSAGRVSVDAMIVGGWRRRNGSEGSFGVKLDLD